MKRILGLLCIGWVLIAVGVALAYSYYIKDFGILVLVPAIGAFSAGIYFITMIGNGKPISFDLPLNTPLNLLFQRSMRDGIQLLVVDKKSVRFYSVSPEDLVLYDEKNRTVSYQDGQWPSQFCFFRPSKKSRKLHVVPKGLDLYEAILSKE